jgi:hypothetical protein
MRIVRWLGILVAGLVAVVVVVAIAARFTDGGIAIFPGGPLESGDLVTGPEPDHDWSFARDVPEMKFQLVDPPRSRSVWLLVNEGRLYLVSGYMKTAIGRLWKKWPAEAERDGRCVIRVEGKRYERTAVRVHDPAVFEALAAEAKRKYDVSITADQIADGEAWVFELQPREHPIGGEP